MLRQPILLSRAIQRYQSYSRWSEAAETIALWACALIVLVTIGVALAAVAVPSAQSKTQLTQAFCWLTVGGVSAMALVYCVIGAIKCCYKPLTVPLDAGQVIMTYDGETEDALPLYYTVDTRPRSNTYPMRPIKNPPPRFIRPPSPPPPRNYALDDLACYI